MNSPVGSPPKDRIRLLGVHHGIQVRAHGDRIGDHDPHPGDEFPACLRGFADPATVQRELLIQVGLTVTITITAVAKQPRELQTTAPIRHSGRIKVPRR